MAGVIIIDRLEATALGERMRPDDPGQIFRCGRRASRKLCCPNCLTLHSSSYSIRRASALGDQAAFRFITGRGEEELCITYGELHQWALAIGGELQARAAHGDRAMLLFPPGLDFVAAFFGCLYAGIVAVPVAPPGRNRVTSSVEPIYDASKPSLILSTSAHRKLAQQSYGQMTKLFDRPWIAVDEVDEARQRVWHDPEVDSRQVAFLQYTSGSTSSPKGVMLSHENLLYNAAVIQKAFGNRPDSKGVFWLPLYHDMGLIGGVMQPIYCGGSCTLLAPAAFLQRPALWLETISQTRATVSGGPDFAYDLCVRKVSAEERATWTSAVGSWHSRAPSGSGPKRSSNLPKPLPPADSAARRFSPAMGWPRRH